MTEKNAEHYLERAEELRQSVAGNYEHSTNIQDMDLVEWLIEQAELRQIDHQASVLANKINTAYTKEVMNENERLRDVLRVVRNNMFNADTVYGIKNLVLEIVDQALEESK